MKRFSIYKIQFKTMMKSKESGKKYYKNKENLQKNLSKTKK